MDNRIVIGSDHGGYELKVKVIEHLKNKGFEVTDKGCFSEESVDYPEFAYETAKAVGTGEFERGIVICGSGIGVSIVANKVPNVRAALCHDVRTAKLSREHNNANIIAFGGRLTKEKNAMMMVDTFLSTNFDGGRHERRVELIHSVTGV
jgi:ribose 5-phosphate isomerase B